MLRLPHLGDTAGSDIIRQRPFGEGRGCYIRGNREQQREGDGVGRSAGNRRAQFDLFCAGEKGRTLKSVLEEHVRACRSCAGVLHIPDREQCAPVSELVSVI